MTIQLPTQLQPLVREVTRLRISLVLLAAAGLASAIWLFAQSDASQAVNLATTAHPDAYTELYFTHHLGLPETVTVGQTVYVPYTVVNHENRPVAYQYRISLVQSDGSRIIEEGSFALAGDQQASRTLHFTPTRRNQTMVIVIELLDQQQKIYFRTKS